MKAVYYISRNRTWGHVATQVWDILDQEGFLQEHTGIIFSGQEVMEYRDEKHEYFFVPMDTAVCLDYPRFLPEMNQYFSDCDMSGMVTYGLSCSYGSNSLVGCACGAWRSGIACAVSCSNG